MTDRPDDRIASPSDAELRRALRPLAGDPIEDMERVLAALPAAPVGTAPPGGSLTRILPWVGLAAAAGLLAGFLAATLTRDGSADPQGIAPPDDRVAGTGTPDGPGGPDPEDRTPARLVLRRGEVFLEAEGGPRAVQVGDRVAADEFLYTAKSEPGWGGMNVNTAMLAFPGDVEVRILGGSRMSLGGPRSLTLLQGEVCVVVPEAAGEFRVATNDGDIAARGATFQVEATENQVAVVTFEGKARFEDLTGSGYEVGGRRILRVVDGVVGEAEAIDLVWSYAAWQAQMLYLCSEHREEALTRALELVEGLADPKLATVCERSLRGAGQLGEEALMYGLMDVAPQREALRRRMALLLSDVGSLMSIRYHLGMLTEDDPDLRVAGFQAYERTTGIETGLEPSFWREAPPAERFDEVQRLRGLVREY